MNSVYYDLDVSGLRFSAEEIQGLREALAADLGRPVEEDDEEIEQMARDTLNYMLTLMRIAEQQRRRGIDI